MVKVLDSSKDPAQLALRRRVRILLRTYWMDPWTPADAWSNNPEYAYLYALHSTQAIGPSLSEASFQYEAGRIKREDVDLVDDYPKLDLLEKFVRIEVEVTRTNAVGITNTAWVHAFTGIIVEESARLLGDAQGPAADQTFKAAGLEILLDRRVIDTSRTFVGSTITTQEIDRCLIFNEQFVRGFTEIGNRSADGVDVDPADPSDDKAYVFADPAADYTVPWNAYDILNYLVHYYPPPGYITGGFRIGGPAANALKSIIPPRLHVAGRTLRQVIDHLIDRKRGIGWCIRFFNKVDEAGDKTPFIYVFSIFETDVVLSTETLSANTEQVSLLTGSSIYLQEGLVAFDSHAKYDTIIVSGEPIKSCFSLSFADVTLREGWTSTEEAAYKNGAGGTNADANDAARGTDKYHHVYTLYEPPPTFNWMTGNGEGTFVAPSNANPKVNDDGTIDFTTQPPIRAWGHLFEHHLPLRKPVELDAQGKPIRLTPEFREPFALVYDPRPGVARYVYAHCHANPNVGHASVRMSDTAFAAEVATNPRHHLAHNHFDSGTAAKATALPAADGYDYALMILTVCAQTDSRPHIVVLVASPDPGRVLRATIRDCEYWHVVPGTVLDVKDDGTLLRQLNDGSQILRDDTPKLKTAANLAKIWYGRDRASCSLHWAFLRDPDDFKPGGLINSVSNDFDFVDVLTVISRVTFDYRSASTRVDTSYTELDLEAASGD